MPGLLVLREEQPTRFEATVYDPVICLILQGAKETGFADRTYRLEKGMALLVSHDLPVTSRITVATPERPYLAVILALDLGILRSLHDAVSDIDAPLSEVSATRANRADPALVDALARYLRASGNTTEAEVLGPLIRREIHFRLLTAPGGGMLRRLVAGGSHASRIAKAISEIRARYREPLAVGALAQASGMGLSSFHEHFKAVTGTTPLRYQKELRLIEARRLLGGGCHSVTAAGLSVGYESAAHFSRDYVRMFGGPPRSDLRRPAPV